MNPRLPLLIGALALAIGGGSAEAGHAHFSGGGGGHFSAHVGGGGGGFHAAGGFRASGGVRFGGGGFHGAAYARGGAWGHGGGWYGGRGYYGRGWGGRVWVGNPYWYARPYYYYPTYVPSYYGEGYYPVQPAYAGPGIAVVAPPPLPRFGIGLFAGGVSVNGQSDSSDVGVLGRFRLTDGLILEGELGKTSYNAQGVSNVRVDRRLGGSLLYEIGARNNLAPYVLVGMGVQQANVNGDYSTDQDFVEAGVGLRYALSRNFHITFDVRAGSRSTVSNDQTAPVNGIAKSVTPPTSDSGQSEDYTRARLAAVLYF